MNIEEFDEEINTLFPGYCTKILDAVLRDFNDCENEFENCKIYKVLKKLPLGYIYTKTIHRTRPNYR
jgi:hypothetical protein